MLNNSVKLGWWWEDGKWYWYTFMTLSVSTLVENRHTKIVKISIQLFCWLSINQNSLLHQPLLLSITDLTP